MIVFTNIPEHTQTTLFDKMNMLEKKVKVTMPGKPVSDAEKGDIKQNYMFSRSVFMRMISLSVDENLKPIVLTAGEIKPGGKITGNFLGSIEGS